MEDQLFRKKSLEHISSPDDLHDYMRVTSPRLWMTLGAILVLLLGFIIYASTATMENVMPIQITCEHTPSYHTDEDGEYVSMGESSIFSAALPISYQDVIRPGMTVRVGEELGKVAITYTMDVSEPEDGLMLFIEMTSDRMFPEGTYDAELVLETTTPISFLWN